MYSFPCAIKIKCRITPPFQSIKRFSDENNDEQMHALSTCGSRLRIGALKSRTRQFSTFSMEKKIDIKYVTENDTPCMWGAHFLDDLPNTPYWIRETLRRSAQPRDGRGRLLCKLYNIQLIVNCYKFKLCANVQYHYEVLDCISIT